MTDGQSVSAPIPKPTSENGVFGGWLDGETAVSFPYIPTADKTLTASFVRGRAEMEWETAGDWLTDAYYSTPDVRKKLNDALTIMASCHIVAPEYRVDQMIYVMIGFSEDATQVNDDVFVVKGSVEYDSKTYYYAVFDKGNHQIINVVEKSVLLNLSTVDKMEIVKTVLDHYYYKDL